MILILFTTRWIVSNFQVLIDTKLWCHILLRDINLLNRCIIYMLELKHRRISQILLRILVNLLCLWNVKEIYIRLKGRISDNSMITLVEFLKKSKLWPFIWNIKITIVTCSVLSIMLICINLIELLQDRIIHHLI